MASASRGHTCDYTGCLVARNQTLSCLLKVGVICVYDDVRHEVTWINCVHLNVTQNTALKLTGTVKGQQNDAGVSLFLRKGEEVEDIQQTEKMTEFK